MNDSKIVRNLHRLQLASGAVSETYADLAMLKMTIGESAASEMLLEVKEVPQRIDELSYPNRFLDSYVACLVSRRP